MSNNEKQPDQPALWDEPGPDATRDQRARVRRPAPPNPGPEPSTRPEPPASVERLWAAADVAAYLGVPKKTVYGWRTSGKGPKGFRVGKHLRWHVATVVQWSLGLERDQ